MAEQLRAPPVFWLHSSLVQISQSLTRTPPPMHQKPCSGKQLSVRLMGDACHPAFHMENTLRSCSRMKRARQQKQQLTRAEPTEDMNDSAAPPCTCSVSRSSPESYSSPDNQRHLCRGLITPYHAERRVRGGGGGEGGGSNV